MPLFLRPRTKYKNRQLPPESPREASRAGGVTLPRYIYGPVTAPMRVVCVGMRNDSAQRSYAPPRRPPCGVMAPDAPKNEQHCTTLLADMLHIPWECLAREALCWRNSQLTKTPPPVHRGLTGRWGPWDASPAPNRI